MATREWKPIKEYTDILFEQYKGIAKITINRPEVYNAFRPLTTTRCSTLSRYAADATISA